MARAKKVTLLVPEATKGHWAPPRVHLYDHREGVLGSLVSLCGLTPYVRMKEGAAEDVTCRKCRKRANLPLIPREEDKAAMARITPSTSTIVQLEDFEPYKFTFKSWDWSVGDAKFGSKRRVEVHLAVNNDPDDTVFDWLNCAVGKQQGTGAPSKLCEFLNAFAGKPAATEIAWFDDETGEWGYEADATYGKLDDLLEHEVIGRGQNKPRPDGEGSRYRLQHYQSVDSLKAKSNGAKSKPKPATAAAAADSDVDPDEIPF